MKLISNERFKKIFSHLKHQGPRQSDPIREEIREDRVDEECGESDHDEDDGAEDHQGGQEPSNVSINGQMDHLH